MASISIREVADRAGVSRATVSRVLNGSITLVTESTRDRVLDAARELGYHPSAVARGLAGKPMDSIGVVLAYRLPSVTSDPFLGPVLDGILEMNKRRRQKTVLFTENDWKDAENNLPTYCDGHCDGLILVIPRSDSGIATELHRRKMPFVVVGQEQEHPEIAVVDVDNVALAYDAVRHLTLQGHRRIAALCGNPELASSGQRLEGYLRALRDAGLAPEEALVLPGEYWEWSGRQNTEALMRRPTGQRPTALFCSNGRIALGALCALDQLKIRVPEEISVTAVCETPTIATAQIRLTATEMPLRQIGERAVECLLERVQQGRTEGDRIFIPGELVIRDSVAPPKRH